MHGAIVATGRRDSRLVYTLQATGRRNCRADRLRRRYGITNTGSRVQHATVSPRSISLLSISTWSNM